MQFPTIQDFAHFGRGLLMGAADVVPGVSGGTVALIVGIYERLVGAISRFDGVLLRLLLSRQWRAAAERIDFRFLVALGLGILTALVSLANLMAYLLIYHRSATLAAFFGLILASTLLVARTIAPRDPQQRLRCWIAGAAGACFAYWLVTRDVLDSPDSLAYYFMCGMVAICAMILPGISGAFILLILGAYETITTVIKDLSHFQATWPDVAKLVVFAAGCGIGLISFSKLVRWLLLRAHNITMSLLCGFMLGSLRRIWPFQRDLTPAVEKLSHKQYEYYVPEAWTAEAMWCAFVAVGALVFVLAVEWWARSFPTANARERT